MGASRENQMSEGLTLLAERQVERQINCPHWRFARLEEPIQRICIIVVVQGLPRKSSAKRIAHGHRR